MGKPGRSLTVSSGVCKGLGLALGLYRSGAHGTGVGAAGHSTPLPALSRSCRWHASSSHRFKPRQREAVAAGRSNAARLGCVVLPLMPTHKAGDIEVDLPVAAVRQLNGDDIVHTIRMPGKRL